MCLSVVFQVGGQYCFLRTVVVLVGSVNIKSCSAAKELCRHWSRMAYLVVGGVNVTLKVHAEGLDKPWKGLKL